MDLQPEASIRRLVERIQSGQIGRQPPPPQRHNLPAFATPFIGREALITSLQEQILAPDCRLLTIVGPGGCGKSRLAVAAVSPLAESGHFRDGIWFVPLAGLPVGAPLAPALVDALPHVAPTPGGSLADDLCAALHGRAVLLLLDGAEHLLTPANLALLRDLIQSGPDVTLVVTSRTRLGLAAEQLVPLAGLAVPSAERPPADTEVMAYDAIALFVDCARRSQPTFELSADNLAPVTAICRLVEGFPLAIELAAQWLPLLTPEALHDELQHSFTIVESGVGAVDGQASSGRAVFETSWRLLGADERDACRALAVFRGGFTRGAALALSEAPLPVLLRLSRASWIQSEDNGRFHMHELLRQYILADSTRAPEAQRTREQRHAAYFAARCARLNEQMRGPHQQAAWDALGDDFDNVRAAWLWLVEQGDFDPVAASLLPALCGYARVRGRILELENLLDHALAALPEDGAAPETAVALAIARDLFGGGRCRMDIIIPLGPLGITAPDRALLEQARAALVDIPIGAIDSWLATAFATRATWHADSAWCKRYLLDSLSTFAALSRLWDEAFVWQCLGILQDVGGYCPTTADAPIDPLAMDAAACLRQAAARFAELYDKFEQANCLCMLAVNDYADCFQEAKWLFQQVGEQGRALLTDCWRGLYLVYMGVERREGFRLLAKTTAALDHLGDEHSWSRAVSYYSIWSFRYGDYAVAYQLRHAVQAYHRRTQDWNMAWDQYELGDMERFAGQPEAARGHLGRALKMFEALDLSSGRSFAHRALGDLALTQGDLDAAHAHHTAAVRLGEHPRNPWNTCYARASLGRTAVARGEWAAARSHFAKAIGDARTLTLPRNVVLFTVTGTSELLAAEGHYQRAAALAAYVVDELRSWHEMRAIATAVLDAVRPHLSQEAYAAAAAEGQKLSMETAVSNSAHRVKCGVTAP